MRTLARAAAAALLFGCLPVLCLAADGLSLAQSPLFLSSGVKANVLVLYDNSQSMDGTMAGKLIAGSDDNTRGNIARRVLRSTLTSYRGAFQWGLGSFELKAAPSLFTTYGYFFGSDSEVRFTDDCVDGVSASNGGLRCVRNPEPFTGGTYLTYKLSGDDPQINDVLYAGDFGGQMWGIGVDGSTKYEVYKNRKVGAPIDAWEADNFSGGLGTWSFYATDAGFLPQTPPYRRISWIRRAWGYNTDITGSAIVNQPVAADSDIQFAALMSLLAPETNANTSELKNAAVFTPLTGSLTTARSYFANTLSGRDTPIDQSCQRNFVLLATDGNPTGKPDGSMYSLQEQANTFDDATQTWHFGVAAGAARDAVAALRQTKVAAPGKPMDGKTFDVQTYVVALGDSVANASSIATLDAMAEKGGTTKAYLASDETALANALRDVSQSIVKATGAASAVALNSSTLSTDTTVYQARFSSADWSGQLLAYAVDSTGAVAASPTWDAAAKLGSLNWSTQRQVITYNRASGQGVPFRWPANPASPSGSEIDPAMVATLDANAGGITDGFGSERLAYLRGDPGREVARCSACSSPTFRNRPTSVLGDIVNSAPTYVGGPTADFRDTIEDTRYSSYAAARAGQPPVIYVGANDGMLHAFDAASGKELFAYVPSAVAGKLSALTDPNYTHLYTVDGTPSVGDVFFAGSWRTVLVSGMNSGAPGLFALDVTDPAKFNEAGAATLVRWELDSRDGDVGYIFGQPLLVKTMNGRWMAVTGNGYNSANGRAVLLLVDLVSGAVTRIDTKVGSSAARNGLSSVAAMSTQNNGIADVVYAGDLQGNLWKFDLSSADPAKWKVTFGTPEVPQAMFTTASGQPITTRPDVTVPPAVRGGTLVSFGTGRYLSESDPASVEAQALYGIWDNGARVTEADLQTQMVVDNGAGQDGSTYRVTTHAVDVPVDGIVTGDNAITTDNYYRFRRGWRLGLADAGERVVSDPSIRFGRLVVSTIVPSSDPCASGGTGFTYAIDVLTGNRSETASFDTNGDSRIDKSDYITLGDVQEPKNASAVRFDQMPTGPSFIRVRQDGLDFAVVNKSNGKTESERLNGNQKKSRRAAWEHIK